MSRRDRPVLIEASFLRRVDARAKLLASVLASMAAMLPLPSLSVACGACLGLQCAAGLRQQTVAQLRRVSWWLAILFVADWWLVDLAHAMTVSLRLILLVTGFVIVFSTTTADELRRAIEAIGVPRRFAFTFATAYRSIDWLAAEWQGVLEAQAARGVPLRRALQGPPWSWPGQLTQLVPLVVPAVVLGTQRAWSLAEAAALRGIDAPGQPPGSPSRLGWREALLVGSSLALLSGLWRWP